MKRLILLLIHPTLFLLCIVNLISCSNTNRYHLEESLQAAGDNRQQLIEKDGTGNREVVEKHSNKQGLFIMIPDSFENDGTYNR